ncbi:uncharacterized protein LOC123307458 isoform X2 [Coccinella septempunctata]|uniref:uncharacterized protein LOC123307458 isoform X2 n=1 Tax=Coccinella septempunctata TaxID=41139 RepID=UPI001D0692DD|nr:uncharacterized protein LOC123307458 isoform X2 [Coccinella septempunctata]
MELEIECGFNINDETINFGSRGIADNEPYESVTFASLRTNAGNTIVSKLNEDQLFCSVGHIFGVFQDEQFSTLKFSCSLDHIIDDFCYCSTRKLLYLFLRNGSLQIFMDTSGSFQVLKVIQIVKEHATDKKLFVNIHLFDCEQDKTSLLAVTSNGQIFKLNILEASDLELSVTFDLICEIEGTIEISTYYNWMLFLHGSEMWLYNLHTNTLSSSKAIDIKSAIFAGSMILSLLSSGQLAYICPVTLLHYLRDIDYPIEAISLIRNERGDVKYINAVSMKDSSEKVQLYLFRPDFSVVYTLTISNDIILIRPESEVDEVRYISLVKKSDGFIELRFQCVIETDPQKRLKRLLRRNMFDEAEQFAKKQNLDVNIVSKEKAKVITEKWRVTKQDIDTLINIFKSLDDHSFILDCCLAIENACQQAEDLLKILKYACELQVPKRDETAKEKQYYCNGLLIRFNLFRLIGENDMDRWNSFLDENLINEVKKLLKQQKVFQAIMLYSNLAQSEIETLNEASIEEILDILNGIDLYVVNPILPRFISITLDWLPSSLLIFMDWLEMKVFQLEKRHNEDFPENAIEFLRVNSEYMKIKDPHKDIKKGNVKNSSQKIQTSFRILNKLEILKSQFGVKVSLNDMMQEPEIVVRNLLNLDLTMDVYNSILQDFTYKYILENGLNPDELFYDALIDILKYQESYWSNIIGSILSCITSQDLKLQAVENMFTRAKLPWSDAVKRIGIQILKECYPKSGNVQQLIADEPRMTVMSRLEYHFDVTNSSNIDDLQFMVKRIIRCNLPTMISDAFVLCENKESCKIDTMRLLLHHFIETGDFTNVLQLLEEDEVIVKKGLELVLADVDHMSEIWTISEYQNYSHILNSGVLVEKYCSLCENDFDSYRWKSKANSLLIAYNMKTHFHVDVTGINIAKLKERKKLMEEIRTRIIDDYESGTKNILEVLESLKLLSTIIGVRREKLFSRCWKTVKVNKNEFLCKVAEEFLIDSVEVKYLCILVVYILQNLSTEDECLVTENSFIDSYSTETSDKYSGEFLKLASQLIAKAICIADVKQLAACLKIVPWVDSIYFFNRYKKQEKNAGCSEDNFDIDNLNPSFASLLAIQKVFTLYTSFIAQFRNVNYKYLCYYNRNEEIMSQETLLKQIKDFETPLYVLNQEGESLLAYKLLTTLQNNLRAHEDLDIRINETLKGIIKKHLISNLVQQSLLMGNINENLLHTSLMWCDAEETEKFIVRTLQHNRKILEKVTTISAIAVKMFNFHKKNDLSSYFKQVILSVSWWEKVKHLNIEYDLFFRVTSEERLKVMIQSQGFDIKLIKDYCQEYNLSDIQSFYFFYLKTYLLNWKPRYEIETNNIGRRKLIMKGNQQKELFHKCSDVLSYIDNKEKVEKMLQEIWSQVNFYYYEVFACILELYRENSFKHLKLMLQFLGSYERINKPCDIEVEKWFNTFQDCQFIDPLSEFRILFNNTLLESKAIWSIICKEISLENYTKWFEAVQAFSFLSIDNICSFLVKELVAQGILKIIKPGDWAIAKHTHLFNEIDKCLDYMKDDMKKITAAYLLLSNTPEGADQVTIAEIAYKYAEEYTLRATDLSQVSISKIEKKYQKCLSLQILHIHELAEQKYVDLILNIEQLLLALYHDERIIKKITNICQYCPDINTAAKKLAKVFNFDITEFRKKLVTSYLLDSNLTDFSGNITIGYLKNLNSSEETENERRENNLKRAVYICSDDIFFWHGYLWNEEYKSDKSDFYRARCVKCLLLCADKIAIRALCSQSYECVVDILDELTLSSILSKFGLQIKLNDMNTWSTVTKKLALIGSRDSVLALAQVCKILKIKKLKYWEYIITNMNKYKMYSDMMEFLEYTKAEDYKYEKFYVDAWTNLIHYTVNEILTSNEIEMEERISKDLIIIQQCPVMFLLNLENTIKRCIQLKRHRVAEELLQYIPKDQISESVLK